MRTWAVGLLGATMVLTASGVGLASHRAVHRASGRNVGWMSTNGPVTGGRYTSLTQINPSNVKDLKVAWRFVNPATYGAEDYPVIVGNVVYFTTTYGNVFAMNATTGKTIWSWKAPTERAAGWSQAFVHGEPNRGVAVGGGMVYVMIPNAVLYAFNQATGQLVYSKVLGNYKYLSESVAPLYYKGVLYLGSSGSESGQRGFEEARSAKTGKLLWQHFTVPRQGAPGSWLYGHHGGGDVWQVPTLDPSLGLMYIGVGNPSPDYYGAKRPGPNLYTDAIMALNMKTGKMVWAYQETPHDLWDYDQAASPTVFPTGSGPVVGDASKGGMWYELSAKTGQLMTAPEAFVTVNHPQPPTNGKSVVIWPGSSGGAEWGPAAYDPQTGEAYVEGINGAGQATAKAVPYSQGLDMGTDLLPAPKGVKTTGTLTAFNVDSGAQVWQDNFPVGLVGGATATGGHLLFVQVSGTGQLDAINPTNGKILASWNLGERIDAGPSVAMVNGKEYVFVSLGGSGPQYGGMVEGHSALVALTLK